MNAANLGYVTRLSAATLKSLVEGLIDQEAQQDGWYLLHTNEPMQKCFASFADHSCGQAAYGAEDSPHRDD